MPDHYSL